MMVVWSVVVMTVILVIGVCFVIWWILNYDNLIE